ncbi:hypothetical protein PR048_008485 [Dryococelus australis]|uniref:Uncharacterized protein n=1 Tax=Dryococelus australis TaxID=614101 RepID=A0ABQ9HX95_9NEOP|nr:hypothetical protein PR048_008485 [Dryococelus australis]
MNTILAYTRQKTKPKYRNLILLERASQKLPSDTHGAPYDRVKRFRERPKQHQEYGAAPVSKEEKNSRARLPLAKIGVTPLGIELTLVKGESFRRTVTPEQDALATATKEMVSAYQHFEPLRKSRDQHFEQRARVINGHRRRIIFIPRWSSSKLFIRFAFPIMYRVSDKRAWNYNTRARPSTSWSAAGITDEREHNCSRPLGWHYDRRGNNASPPHLPAHHKMRAPYYTAIEQWRELGRGAMFEKISASVGIKETIPAFILSDLGISWTIRNQVGYAGNRARILPNNLHFWRFLQHHAQQTTDTLIPLLSLILILSQESKKPILSSSSIYHSPRAYAHRYYYCTSHHSSGTIDPISTVNCPYCPHAHPH